MGPSIHGSTFIRYPRLEQLHQDIHLCREMSRLSGEAHCMVLEGMTGAGKTTLVQGYLAQHARQETAEGSQIPVLYVSTPSPVTIKGMAAVMLRHLGDPAYSYGTLWTMNERLMYFINVCAVELVILDDFHHLIDAETRRVLENVSNWLKVLIKETQTPFLVLGIEGSVSQILDTNPQLRRLFATREKLHPFLFEASNPQASLDFARFVKSVVNSVGIPFSDELEALEWLQRIHYATDGVIAHIVNLIQMSTLLARMAQQEVLSLEILAQTFAKRFAVNMPHKANPFLANSAAWDSTPSSSSANNQTNRQGPILTSLSEVLRAR